MDQLVEAWPEVERRDRTIVVAVSGGADSVALLHGLADLKESRRLIVAHYNHNLRGDASAEDAEFVKRLSARLSVPCLVQVAVEGEIPAAGADGLESAARDARYRFFAAIARERGARFVATGHTWNDQVETILHRLLRGSGLDGLAGIPRARPLNEWTIVVRPMLAISRETVLEYLAAIGGEFRHDASNDDVDLTRNRLRHELLPLLETHYNPRVGDALTRLGRLADETQDFVRQQTAALFAETIRCDARGAEVNAARLAQESPFVVRALLTQLWREADWPRQAMSFAQWERLAAAVRATQPVTFDLPGPIRVTASAGRLQLTRLS